MVRTPIKKKAFIAINSLKYVPLQSPLWLKHCRKKRGYTEAKIGKIIHVRPDKITQCSNREFRKFGHEGKIMRGDWDTTGEPFRTASFYSGLESSFYLSLYQRYTKSTMWEDTDFVSEVIEKLSNRKQSYWGCENKNEVLSKCEKIDRLYYNIKNNGYKKQKEMNYSGGETLSKSINRYIKSKTILGLDEIAVDIGRDGELLFYDGKHRLSIAKILNIDTVPARVIVRHKRWEKTRNNSSQNTNYNNTLGSHPDLVE